MTSGCGTTTGCDGTTRAGVRGRCVSRSLEGLLVFQPNGIVRNLGKRIRFHLGRRLGILSGRRFPGQDRNGLGFDGDGLRGMGFTPAGGGAGHPERSPGRSVKQRTSVPQL